MKGTALNVDVTGPKTIVFAAHPCIFLPGNITGWGREWVKGELRSTTLCEPVWPSGKALGW